MKLSNKTINVLKNFATINPSIAFKQGNVISTVSPQKNILAEARIDETFPRDFSIFYLNNFLSVISLFNKDSAELSFGDTSVEILGMGGRSMITFRYTNPNLIVAAPEKRPTLPSVDIKFSLSEDDFNWVMKAASVLGSPNIAVSSDGSKVTLVTFDVTNDSAHTNSVNLDDVDPNGKVFNLIFKTENLKMISGCYDVEICSKGISKFVDDNAGLTYYITLETTSTFG